ncbi:MAG TPA: hypothetical protein VF043_12970 [Ktedonobacteraceae bacterium]
MRSLNSLSEELMLFLFWLQDLNDIREDAMSGMLSRKPDDLPFISGTNRVGSPVERIVIHILSGGHVEQLERAVHAATIVFFEFPHY